MNNEKKLWFRAKRFGWGWQPSSWQGWAITVIYLIGILHYAIEDNGQHSASDFLINFGFDFVVLTIPFLVICYLKGETPHWNWSWKDKESGVDKNPPQAQQ